MCITSGPASLSKTKILSFKMEDGKIYLAYANKVANRSADKNAMILPIPGEVDPNDLIDTTKYSGYLKTIADNTVISEYLAYGIRTRGMTLGERTKSLSFTQVGMYQIYLLKDLSGLLPDLGIPISTEMVEFFHNTYPNFTFVVCVFDSAQTMDAQPIALRYTPINPDMLFFPTMDAHSGKPPVEGEEVDVDHSIITVMEDQRWGDVPVANGPDYLNQTYGTYKLQSSYDNGDIYLDLKQRMSDPDLKRSFDVIIYT